MAKYHASPWGDMLGKLGDTVGGKWRGVYWTRKWVEPTQRGTLDLYRLLKAGLISPQRFSFKQMNLRRMVFQLLGWIGKENRAILMWPVWDLLAKKRGFVMTGINLFIKRNAPVLWATVPKIDEEYEPAVNEPDMEKMLVTDGDLEATSEVTTCTYNPITGELSISWDTAVYKNGDASDYTYVMAYVKPIIDLETWRPNGWLYGKPELPEPPAPVIVRGNGTMVLTLPEGLTATDIIGYVFFKDTDGIIGWSPSVGKQASAV